MASPENWMLQFLGGMSGMGGSQYPSSSHQSLPDQPKPKVLARPTLQPPSASSTDSQPAMEEEQRVDPTDGALYSKEIFLGLYGDEQGEINWQNAEPERRVDTTDGRPYTKQSFVDLYGGTKEWDNALPWTPTPKEFAAYKELQQEMLKAQQEMLKAQQEIQRMDNEIQQEKQKRPPPNLPMEEPASKKAKVAIHSISAAAGLDQDLNDSTFDPEVEEFITTHSINPSVAHLLRKSPALVQKTVCSGFSINATNPSGMLRSRIITASAHFEKLNAFIMKNGIDGSTVQCILEQSVGVQKGIMRLPYTQGGTLENYIDSCKALGKNVEKFLFINRIDESAAKMLRDSDPAIQNDVLNRSDPVMSVSNPSGALTSRVKVAEGHLRDGIIDFCGI